MADLAKEFAHLVLRQVATGGDDVAPDAGEEAAPECELGNEYNGRMGLRISSIFVILVGSCLGAWFPVFARRHAGLHVPEWAFFVAKYFGSGVIIATAFIHLLAPANEALTNECLTGVVSDYPWVEGIALITIFMLFFLELMVMRFAKFGGDDGHGHTHSPSAGSIQTNGTNDPEANSKTIRDVAPAPSTGATHGPGNDHLGHRKTHVDNDDVPQDWRSPNNMIIPETYAAQMTAIFILEFGVIFHSVFIGLTLAVAGDELVTLYIVLVFHQTFEGLGLGSRLASAPWPKSKRWTPYLLALGYGISTPISIAIGLGVRTSYPPESRTTLIVNGIFDSISAGILIYTGLVELMAHEFMFSNYMQKAPLKTVLSAFGMMVAGAGLMALLGYWA
ncbi:low-affinity zinc ion transporter-like protein [Patellaria atrata CBS 101060]|uniref:Low-affinity zinc ion transporter-like protein n=1 Tax=Patellaria atrata CBS 101060 TaxID=1346257 RepID=A0A9P4VMW4_9PEZI|nr:low-affinity zinc ion transporter-like protein [Patellaria atrata CBS 101060]